MKRYVVCYDISSNSARVRVMKKLKDQGFHSQFSFFEVTARSSEELEKSVNPALEETDRFAIIRVSSRGEIKRLGSLLEGMEWVL